MRTIAMSAANAATGLNRHLAGLSQGRILLLLFIVALLLRIVGIHYGYWHGDERINDAAKVLTGQLVPGQHFYPPLLNYINAVFLAILYALGRLVPVWHSTAEFRAQYFSDPTAFYLVCRFITAAMSALTAPLFYLVAKSLGMAKNACIAAGIFGVVIPVMVLLSHLAKSDVPLATSAVLVFYVLLEKYKHLSRVKYDVFLALAAALALSFKHSYVFILAPLMLGHALLLWRASDFASTAKSLLLTASILICAWCVLNIGILLDLQNFIDFQKIQAQMSVRGDESAIDALATWLALAAHLSYGVNPLVTGLFIIFPLYLNSGLSQLPSRALLNTFWIAIAFGTLVIALMSGTRQHAGLWVPYFTCMQLFAALMLADVFRPALRSLRYASLSVGAVSLLLSVYGSLVVWRQALAQPIADAVAQFVRQHYQERKIMTSFALRLPQSAQAQVAERERHERLAEKYGIALPQRAAENVGLRSPADGIDFRHMPTVMFGLENSDDESLGDAIKPFAWPLQTEEWRLEHWLAQGFDLFVFSDYDYYLNKTTVATFREFYAQVNAHCQQVKVFHPTKPLFLEATVSVFDCKGG